MKNLLITITILVVPLLAFSQRWNYVTNDSFTVPEHTRYWSNSTFYVVADTSLEAQPLTIVPPSGYTVDGAATLDIDYGEKGTIIALHTDTSSQDVVIDYVIPIRNGKISERESYYDIASASTLDISVTSSESIFVSGTTTINLMSGVKRKKGDKVTLIFAASLTLTSSAVSAGTNYPFLLNGGVNFSATANDSVTVMLNGSNQWVQVAYSIN